jgi:hypothetical protein
VGAVEQDWSFVFEGHFSMKDEIQVEAAGYVVVVAGAVGRHHLE